MRTANHQNEDIELEDNAVHPSAPRPVDEGVEDVLSETIRWQLMRKIQGQDPGRQGAWMIKVEEHVWIMGVRGWQPSHHDRHMIALHGWDATHTWNHVLTGDGSQMLCLAIEEGCYEHLPMETGATFYFNTSNPHHVSRRDASDLCMIVQVCGFGPDDKEDALNEIRRACADMEGRLQAAE